MKTEDKTKERPIHKISGAEHPLKDVFSDEFDFVIPPYQRPYSWTTEHAGELYDDLQNFMNDSRSSKNDYPYFLGSIVLIKRDGLSRAEVIDGQQRLTTLTILLAAVVEKLSGKEKIAVAKYINEPGDLAEDLEPKPRLAMRERDREFFRDNIQTEGGVSKLAGMNPDELTDPRKNMVLNGRLFVERLQKLDAAAAFDFAKFIVNRCYLVAVATPTMQSAFKIFSVLNDRGLNLLPTDILKSDIIGKIPSAKQDTYTQKWEETEDDLGRDAFNDLFAHIRMTRLRGKPQKTLLEDFRNLVVEKEKEPTKLIDNLVVPYAETFDTIRNASFDDTKYAEESNAVLKWLARIDNSDWIPPALMFLERNEKKPDQVLRFLTDLERLAASMFICRRDVNSRIERYSKLMNAIDGGKLWAADCPLTLARNEKIATTGALNGSIYEMNHNVRNYVLLRLDSWLADRSATYDHKILTVEHVLPQTVDPKSKWATTWPDEIQRAECVHRLGNLVLLSRRKNSEAQNYDFDTKKEKYFRSKSGVCSFAITTSVLKENTWTPDVVRERQTDLLAKLKTGWAL